MFGFEPQASTYVSKPFEKDKRTIQTVQTVSNVSDVRAHLGSPYMQHWAQLKYSEKYASWKQGANMHIYPDRRPYTFELQ